MKRIIVTALLLAVAFLAWQRYGEPHVGTDPAYSVHTRDRSPHYGGIDHWSYHGMEADSFAAQLRVRGYSCPPAVRMVGREAPTGVQEMICSRTLSPPLARTLTIAARVDHDSGRRIVAIEAMSGLPDGTPWLARQMATLLRSVGLIEPAVLAVRGFAPDSVQVFARLVADALHPAGWQLQCRGGGEWQRPCVTMANERFRTGLPQLPAGGAPATRARLVDVALRGIGLMPVVAQDKDNKRAGRLPVRVDGTRMWLDYSGQDFSGRPLTASVALDGKGGAPASLHVQAAGAAMDVALAGQGEKSNDGQSRYLVPASGAGERRLGDWLDLPSAAGNGDARIADVLKHADPGFLPGAIVAIAGAVGEPDSPDESLGLYPVLRAVERRAAMLRSIQARAWFPADEREKLIAAMHPEDAIMRAAWAVALCDGSRGGLVLDDECWRDLALSDARVVDLLLSAVAEQEPTYAELPASHRLPGHLRRLRQALDEHQPDPVSVSGIAAQ